MAYASWSVVFGEQPSAAKWNILGTNDAYFNTQIGSNFSSSTTSTVWWEELGRTTLGSGADTITLSSLAARQYLRIYIYTMATGGNITQLIRFNNDSAGNYARRTVVNDTASSATAQTSVDSGFSAGATPIQSCIDVINLTAQEKMCVGLTSSPATAGAATAPSLAYYAYKWANTSAQISRVDIINGSTGDFATGSQVIVLGHD